MCDPDSDESEGPVDDVKNVERESVVLTSTQASVSLDSPEGQSTSRAQASSTRNSKDNAPSSVAQKKEETACRRR